MNDIGFSAKSFTLFELLAENNNRDWFDEHRSEFKTHLQAPFAFMLDCVTRELSDHSLPLTGSKSTMFRLHRDTRFSKNKAPYNLHVSGLLTRSGNKNESGGLTYAMINAEGGRVAAGFYNLDAKALAPIRDKMIADPNTFEAMIEALNKSGLTLSFDNSLTNMPRGYKDYADHKLAKYLKLKSFVTFRPLTRDNWIKGDIVGTIADYAKAATPLLNYGAIK